MNINELIDKLGGTCAVAELLGIQPPSVSGWKSSNPPAIPADKLIKLSVIAEERGITTRKALFPTEWKKIWPELVRKNSPKPSCVNLIV